MMLFKGDDSWLALRFRVPHRDGAPRDGLFLLLVVPQVQNYRALRAKR